MCTGGFKKSLAFLEDNAKDLWQSGRDNWDDINPLAAPDIPKPPDPLKPADPANPGAEDLWSPKGLKNAQALSARLGTNALVVPFQSTNVV